MYTDETQPTLEAPGQGLPTIELLIARLIVAFKQRRTTPEQALKAFLLERDQILLIVESVSTELRTKRVLINRLRGMEDSSRNWSLYMTMEHLNIVNQATIRTIQSLLAGKVPTTAASTAAVKPKGENDGAVIETFKSVCADFENKIPANESLRTSVTFAHPWFGELNAAQWHFFAGFHMRLHRGQMLKISAKLLTR